MNFFYIILKKNPKKSRKESKKTRIVHLTDDIYLVSAAPSENCEMK